MKKALGSIPSAKKKIKTKEILWSTQAQHLPRCYENTEGCTPKTAPLGPEKEGDVRLGTGWGSDWLPACCRHPV